MIAAKIIIMIVIVVLMVFVGVYSHNQMEEKVEEVVSGFDERLKKQSLSVSSIRKVVSG